MSKLLYKRAKLKLAEKCREAVALLEVEVLNNKLYLVLKYREANTQFQTPINDSVELVSAHSNREAAIEAAVANQP